MLGLKNEVRGPLSYKMVPGGIQTTNYNEDAFARLPRGLKRELAHRGAGSWPTEKVGNRTIIKVGDDEENIELVRSLFRANGFVEQD